MDRTNNYDKNRGLRLKRFRMEVLKISQKDFAVELRISQSKMSLIESGQMPDQMCIDYYTQKKANWHWIITGEGEMKTESQKKSKRNRLLQIEKETSDKPLERFFNDIKKYEEAYNLVNSSEEYDLEEAEFYEYVLADKINEKNSILQSCYNDED